ncbi:MAG: hypothetical protein AMQ22_00036 [Candidatus Methanofastidiosum methylothiophilum]|uniref:Uncharacterized protein n=1 Tax=Candidatus Methanofastidiosum methylothiophilum TaxID=1705564 RepID=A0A150J9C6_9EURY|nr:MAG: hypothetical protein AMQ22_00036 [Candidatus Methanofastidiosum methylthiophilus]
MGIVVERSILGPNFNRYMAKEFSMFIQDCFIRSLQNKNKE